MSRLRTLLFPALAQALVLLGLAAALAWLTNGWPGGLAWSPAPAQHAAAAVVLAAEQGIPDIGLDEARALHGQGVLFLDARYPADFAAGHVPGARNLSPELFTDQVEALLADGPKDRPLVAYCHDPACPMARELAGNLALQGHTGVRVFTGGMAEWAAAGEPVARGDAP